MRQLAGFKRIPGHGYTLAGAVQEVSGWGSGRARGWR